MVYVVYFRHSSQSSISFNVLDWDLEWKLLDILLIEGFQKNSQLLTKLGLSIAEIAEELEIDVALVNQFVANQNN
jgi:hypothetical protein